MIDVYPRFYIGSGRVMGRDGLVHQYRVLDAHLVVRLEFNIFNFSFPTTKPLNYSGALGWKGELCNLRH
jgi:hypothetical protein